MPIKYQCAVMVLAGFMAIAMAFSATSNLEGVDIRQKLGSQGIIALPQPAIASVQTP